MDLDQFIIDFANLFDDTDESEITANTEFHELEEWGSITGLALIAMVETNYDKKLTGAEIRSCDTVEDLFNLINSK